MRSGCSPPDFPGLLDHITYWITGAAQMIENRLALAGPEIEVAPLLVDETDTRNHEALDWADAFSISRLSIPMTSHQSRPLPAPD